MRSLRQGAVDRQTGQLLAQAVFQDLAPEHPEDPRQARDELSPRTRLHIMHQGRQDREDLMQGVVKVYDATTGIGTIVRDDDRSEVLLRPGSLDGSMFRFVRQGQRVRFDLNGEGRDAYATNLRFGSDGY
jgi:CspA family cold shock protein